MVLCLTDIGLRFYIDLAGDVAANFDIPIIVAAAVSMLHNFLYFLIVLPIMLKVSNVKQLHIHICLQIRHHRLSLERLYCHLQKLFVFDQ